MPYGGYTQEPASQIVVVHHAVVALLEDSSRPEKWLVLIMAISPSIGHGH